MQIEITPDYLKSQGLSPEFPERFWKRIFIMTEGRGCWLWTASCHDFGYGQLARGFGSKIPIHAHVASWILHFGPVPSGLYVCHHCDVPQCCNPYHLFLGTQLENMRDAKRKNRNAKGESQGSSKLTEKDVTEIRRRYIKGSGVKDRGNCQELSREFGIHPRALRLIAHKDRWRHI